MLIFGRCRYYWIWLLLTALILAGCSEQLQSETMFISQQEDSGLIAYIGTDGNLYTIDHEGENKKLVFDKSSLIQQDALDETTIQQPTWSPNGDSIAVIIAQEPANAESKMSIYTLPLDGSQPFEIFNSAGQSPFYLFWSPDSQMLSFLSSSRDADGLMLQMVPVEGGEVQVIGIGQPYYWDWSPDNRSILTHTGGSARINPEARISLQLHNGEIEETELALKPSAFQAPDWSPDGQSWLLAAEDENGEESLLITNTEGDILNVLTPVERSISFAWSPDGEKVAYLTETPVDQEDPTATLEIVNLDDKNNGMITVEQNPVVAFFWSPDGRRIAYIVPKLKLPQGEITQLDLPEAVLIFQLYVLDVIEGKSSLLFEFDPTAEFLSVMQFFDQYHHSASIWSPDSRYIVISGMDQEDNPGIFVVPLSKEESSRLVADGTLAFWSWR